MKKLLYIAHGLNRLTGVRKKVYAQCVGLESAGFLVSLVSIDYSFGDLCVAVGSPGISGNFRPFIFDRYKGFFSSLLVKFKMIWAAFSSLKKESPDIIYLRYPVADPFWILFLLFCSVPVVVEYQTKELDEFALRGKLSWGYLSELFFGRVFRFLTSGIVAVTDEIRRYELSKAWPRDIKAITVGNGFDVESVELRNLPDLIETVHVLFVANISIWHGLDRFINGMNQAMNVKMVLHVVGDGGILSELIDLAGPSKDRIVFHGALLGEELDKIFNECHVAIGSLASGRKKLKETSELKAREYCSRGIPFAISALDPDFPDDYPYILKLPPGESPIDIDMIVAFAKKMMAERCHNINMRSYAMEKLIWKKKARQISDFIFNIL